jgi:hypothetical protein
VHRLIASAIVVVALAGCGGGASASNGGITFNPATVNCSHGNPGSWTITTKLPASVKPSDTVTTTVDGKTASSNTVTVAGFVSQADNTWLLTSTTVWTDMQTECAKGSASAVLAPGTHTIAILDASGHVLAQGSYTVD